MKTIIATLVLFLFVTSCLNVVNAQEVEDGGDYVELEEGQEAPYSGFLFDKDGIATLIAKSDKEKELIIVEKDSEYKKLKISLEAEVSKKQAEIDTNKELAEKVLKLNKEELKLTKQKLDKVSWLSPTMFVAGITLGAVFTISILKVAVEVTK